MELLHHFIVDYAPHAHYIIFFLILLAGLNLPISLDALTITAAILAATVVPQNTYKLFLSIWLGATLSACISYWFGRIVGNRLIHIPFFRRLLPQKQIAKMHRFYEKRGRWALVIGRFIPFGIRNALFMTAGISKFSFKTFVTTDFFACFFWAAICFPIYYSIGQNYDFIHSHLKVANGIIGTIFLIGLIAYLMDRRKKKKTKPH